MTEPAGDVLTDPVAAVVAVVTAVTGLDPSLPVGAVGGCSPGRAACAAWPRPWKPGWLCSLAMARRRPLRAAAPRQHALCGRAGLRGVHHPEDRLLQRVWADRALHGVQDHRPAMVPRRSGQGRDHPVAVVLSCRRGSMSDPRFSACPVANSIAPYRKELRS
jgi:hypothetical protein